MTGFAGLLSTPALDRATTGEMLAGMASDIAFASSDLVETHMEDHFGVTRVHHGLLNPEPQPIFNEDGTLCIVMDGEVFGYERERRALEDRGHRFRFVSNDAEYCLHLYEEYGERAFVRLNGSFALVIHNQETGELLLVTDRVSSYPLFYYCGSGATVFGTQLRPLLRYPTLPRRLDLRTVFEFFALDAVLGDHTYYMDVKALPPAVILQVQGGESTLVRYWTLASGDHTDPEDRYVEALADGLRHAAARKTRGNHRFGILLSGGLDSRSVAASTRQPMTAFTLGEFVNREVKIAQRVARARGIEHVFLRRGPNHYPDSVAEAVAIGDGMQRFDHALVLGVTDEIRAGCDVVLDAFGFDSFLKGWSAVEQQVSLFGRRFHIPRLVEIADATTAETYLELVPFPHLATFPGLFRSPHRQTARDTLAASVSELWKRCPEGHPVDQLAYPEISSCRSNEGYLMVQAARAHLPQRSLIFDNDLLELSLAIPPGWRARGRVLRRALRQLSPELAAIPDSSTGLRADLPVWLQWLITGGRTAMRDAGLWPRPKLPHPTYTTRAWPYFSELVRHNDKLRRMIEATIRDPDCLNPDLFDVQALEGILRRHLETGEDSGRRLFQLLTFGRWHKSYGPR